jgi:U3 small nucleolar RNA-associated protein 10
LSELSLFAEVLASTDLPGSIELISRAMDALHHVVQFSSSTTMDVNYIEQLLMTALSKIVEKIDVSAFQKIRDLFKC